jgi:hypothetical protein
MPNTGNDELPTIGRVVNTDDMIIDSVYVDNDDSDGTDDPDFDYFVQTEGIHEEMDDDDDYEDDDDYDEDDEDAPQAFFTDPTTGAVYLDDDEMEEDDDENDEDYEDVDEEDDDGAALRHITALLNNAHSAEARSSLLAQLLAGPQDDMGGDDMRPAGFLRRLNGGRIATPEERARAEADRRKRERWWKPQLEPHPAGAELLATGEFGRVRNWSGTGKGRRAPRRCLTRNRLYDWTPTISQVSRLDRRLLFELIPFRRLYQIPMGPSLHRTQVSLMLVSTLERIMVCSVSDLIL